MDSPTVVEGARVENTQWTLNSASLEALLAALGQDRDKAIQEYERLRRRLIRFFLLHGAALPEDLADSAFDRLARKLNEGVVVRQIPAYLAGIARLLLREEWSKEQRNKENARLAVLPGETREADDQEIIDSCLQALPPRSQDLIRRYYSTEGGPSVGVRKKMASEMGISLNALRNRALRIRQDLEECVRKRIEASAGQDK
ncbi:MAG: sigma-70 family RNA polymerase sigma factor [Acidobacteriota bacterium]|nr:sigma-70 family RNA polymerase sigma factor [Acidobacteriota bacterium]